MRTQNNNLRRLLLGSGLAIALALASGCSKDSATDHMKSMSDDEHQKMQTK